MSFTTPKITKFLTIVTDDIASLGKPGDKIDTSYIVEAVQLLPISPYEEITITLDKPVGVYEDGQQQAINTFTIARQGATQYVVYDPESSQARMFFLEANSKDVMVAESGDYDQFNEVGISEMSGNRFRTSLSTIALFMSMVESNKLYPFHVTVDNIDKIKNPYKLKKARDKHDTIVYLGKPPTDNRLTGEGDTIEFGYPRIGYRKTLKHERFKNHPKFQIYKGVAVKQAWCGPEEYRFKKRTYKLWKPTGFDIT